MFAESNAKGARPALRKYRCRSCGHRLRFGSARCGDCWVRTPIYNQRWFWRSIYASGATCALLASWLISRFI